MSGSVEYLIKDGVAYPIAGTFDLGQSTEQMRGQTSGQSSGQSFGQSFGQPFGQRSEHPGHSENVSALLSDGAGGSAFHRVDSATPYDPHRVHREFPERWQAYIRANYRNLLHVQQVFGVSERTARKWWNGETGANGGHVAIAVNEHPVAAPIMLFAAE